MSETLNTGDRLRGLILGGQHAYGRNRAKNQPDGRDPELFFTSFFSSIGLDFATQPAELRKALLASDTLALAAARQDRPSLEDSLLAMPMPSLLYAGTNDAVLPLAEKSARAMPNCRFLPLPDLDHSEGFYKAAPLLVPEVLGFLHGLEA